MSLTTEPTGATDWASQDVPNGPSGNNNKIEPPAQFKNEGFAYKQKPPREVWNGWSYNVHAWARWSRENLIAMDILVTALGGQIKKVVTILVSDGSYYLSKEVHGINDPSATLKNSVGKQVYADITIDGSEGVIINDTIDGLYELTVK